MIPEPDPEYETGAMLTASPPFLFRYPDCASSDFGQSPDVTDTPPLEAAPTHSQAYAAGAY